MTWYWILRRNHYHYHPNGIALYAEKAVALIAAQSLEELKKGESTVYGLLADCKSLARMIQQKWNKLRDLGASDRPFVSPITPEKYEDLKLRIGRGRLMLLGFFLGEAFLNYLSLLVFISSSDPFMIFVRAVIAAMFTLVAFKIFNSTLEAWDPKEEAHLRVRATTAIGALVVLVSIAGVTTARARDFEGGADSGIGIVGLGFIFFSLVLPIAGGAVDLELGRTQPLYRRMRKWRASLKAVRKFEGRMHSDLTETYKVLTKVDTNIHEHASRMFAGVMDFRVAKNSRDERIGKPLEDLTGTPADTLGAFTSACLKACAARRDDYETSITPDRVELEALVKRSIEISGPLVAASGLEQNPVASAAKAAM